MRLEEHKRLEHMYILENRKKMARVAVTKRKNLGLRFRVVFSQRSLIKEITEIQNRTHFASDL